MKAERESLCCCNDKNKELIAIKNKLEKTKTWLLAFSDYDHVQPDFLRQSAKSLLNNINEDINE